MENKNKIPQEIMKDLIDQMVYQHGEPDTKVLDAIAYTLWGIIHKLPMTLIKGYVYELVDREDLEGLSFETDQEYKNYLHDMWFFDEVRNQGLDGGSHEDYSDMILQYYEETCNNL